MAQKRERAHLEWSPKWEGVVSGWTANFIRRNHWRCDALHEFDDLMQDAFLVFLKICDKYPRVIEERHFVALYKRAITNQFHDRALYMKRKRVLHQDTAQDVSELYTGRIGELTNGGYAAALLNEAPEELKLALEVFIKNPEALRTPAKAKERQNLNSKLRKALGLGEGYDFVGELKALFS